MMLRGRIQTWSISGSVARGGDTARRPSTAIIPMGAYKSAPPRASVGFLQTTSHDVLLSCGARSLASPGGRVCFPWTAVPSRSPFRGRRGE